jgi:hypothetical protein
VFLLLLCNDKAVLGPWVNGTRVNVFTGAVIAVLVMLSVVLTASVVFPALSGATIVAILAVGTGLTVAAGLAVGLRRVLRGHSTGRLDDLADAVIDAEAGGAATETDGCVTEPDGCVTEPDLDATQGDDVTIRSTWRMPPLALLARPELSLTRRAGLGVLWVYLVVACGLVVVRVVELALGH